MKDASVYIQILAETKQHICSDIRIARINKLTVLFLGKYVCIMDNFDDRMFLSLQKTLGSYRLLHDVLCRPIPPEF